MKANRFTAWVAETALVADVTGLRGLTGLTNENVNGFRPIRDDRMQTHVHQMDGCQGLMPQTSPTRADAPVGLRRHWEMTLRNQATAAVQTDQTPQTPLRPSPPHAGEIPDGFESRVALKSLPMEVYTQPGAAAGVLEHELAADADPERAAIIEMEARAPRPVAEAFACLLCVLPHETSSEAQQAINAFGRALDVRAADLPSGRR